MRVAVRADSSLAIGTGHVARCLTLATALRDGGETVRFICRRQPGDCCDLIRGQGFVVLPLLYEGEVSPESDAAAVLGALDGWKPELLVVDHYRLDAAWERRLRPEAGRILVIDDLADRRHDCDALLDQNLVQGLEHRYDGLTPPGCALFLGPRYALLRDEFIRVRRTLRQRSGEAKRILVSFGGSDPTNETEKALLALRKCAPGDAVVDVVAGRANPNGARLREICSSRAGFFFHCQPDDMASLAAAADLAVGAGGISLWERCFLGVPSLLVVVAQNQEGSAREARARGLAHLAGSSSEVTVDALADALDHMLHRPDLLREMSRRCLSFMEARDASVHHDVLRFLREENHGT